MAKLKAIADEFGTGWNYAPLHTMLNAAEREWKIELCVLTDS